MKRPMMFEDKFYVYVPVALFKFSKEEWGDFKEEAKVKSLDDFRNHYELVDLIRRYRNRH